MTSFLRTPDLVVYLRAGVETLQERIRCRGRDCEREISSEYLRALNRAYEDWCARAARITDVLTIDTEGLDLVQDEAAVERVLARVVGRLGLAVREEQPVGVGLELASI
jgi:deoxyadenosine/deoxycytidine kinase